MSAVTYGGRPPRGTDLWSRILEFVEKHDPRTMRGALLYAAIGLAIGFMLG